MRADDRLAELAADPALLDDPGTPPYYAPQAARLGSVRKALACVATGAGVVPAAGGVVLA